MRIVSLVVFFLYLLIGSASAQPVKSNMHFVVSTPEPAMHYFDVELTYQHPGDTAVLKMPVWSPGGYFVVNHAENLGNFSAVNESGNSLKWTKSGQSSWTIVTGGATEIVVRYRIFGNRPGIDRPYVEREWGLIGPTGIFLYADKELKKPVTANVDPYLKWNAPLATGMDSITGRKNTFYAEDFDILFDSPILMGNIETLEPAMIKGVPHYFTGYEIGKLNRKQFMADLKKFTAAGIAIIGDIPYKHYSYLSIGYGGGGIEHLNSTVVSFRTKDFLSTKEARFRNYKLLAHEYFHHYNVKRIRPVELGPFDYSAPNYTKLLWFSEGVTDYYAHLMLLRSGLFDVNDITRNFQYIIRNYENKPGHKYQSLTESSLATWDNSPFSKTKAQADRSISYYEKGCIVGMMMDFEIRNRTMNKYSLDDVMRFLYKKYYQDLKRGFTEEELKAACESFAGGGMDEVFSYVTTTSEVNYPKYFAYAGLQIDTAIIDGSYMGFTTGVQMRGWLTVNSVEESGPAGTAGLKVGDMILDIDGREPNVEVINDVLLTKKPGDLVTFKVKREEKENTISLKLGSQPEKKFSISVMKNMNALQKEILNSWKRIQTQF